MTTLFEVGKVYGCANIYGIEKYTVTKRTEKSVWLSHEDACLSIKYKIETDSDYNEIIRLNKFGKVLYATKEVC